MAEYRPIERLVDLMDPQANVLLNMSVEEASAAVAAGDRAQIAAIQGQFAIVQKRGQMVRMARSLGRPMRYFLAKRAEGPCLLVAERIDQLADFLRREGLARQFQPAYSRMVPAHHLVEISLVGCPDPNPCYTRFFAPQRNVLPADRETIGRAYVEALAAACDQWLEQVPADEPLGVLFSGGIDSGAVLLLLHHLLLRRGQAPTRLKAFTLSVEGTAADAAQARRFLAPLGLEFLLETLEVPAGAIDFRDGIRVLEDYKPLDVQAATMALTLCRAIRNRYPGWTWLVDGDGGDENLKDYPIEDNPELTIRSVLNNRMLYQEGWGVDAIKHSLTYSGGQSRGHVRSYAPARTLGFRGFSPYAVPAVIAVAEGIPFIELTNWDHGALYGLKGDLVRRGIRAVTGLEMPVFEKRRFQHGVMQRDRFEQLFPADESSYRQAFADIFASAG